VVGWMRYQVVRCPASPGETSGGRHADQAAARRFAGWVAGGGICKGGVSASSLGGLIFVRKLGSFSL
jgi:hypothetical protein